MYSFYNEEAKNLCCGTGCGDVSTSEDGSISVGGLSSSGGSSSDVDSIADGGLSAGAGQCCQRFSILCYSCEVLHSYTIKKLDLTGNRC